MKHLLNWIEIPVVNLTRAKQFYSQILGAGFYDMAIGETQYALLSCEDKFNNGALAQGAYYKPCTDGVLIYLNGGDNLENVLSKVPAAGGNIIMPKTHLSKEAGYIGMFIDTEGNRIGVQSLQ